MVRSRQDGSHVTRRVTGAAALRAEQCGAGPTGPSATRETPAQRLLVVGDDSGSRAALCAVVRQRFPQLQFLEASCGPEAQGIAVRFRPDAVLLDVQRAGASGIEVCRRLKGDPATAEAPMIIMAARRAGAAHAGRGAGGRSR